MKSKNIKIIGISAGLLLGLLFNLVINILFYYMLSSDSAGDLGKSITGAIGDSAVWGNPVSPFFGAIIGYGVAVLVLREQKNKPIKE